VSDTTLETPHALPPEEGRTPPRATDPPPRGALGRATWWLVALAVVAVAAILLRWANTRPGYDPYGWLDWGYQTLRGTLDLGGAPSWKPFTYIFTLPYALFGHYALYLWMLTAVSISLSGAVFGGRIAYRVIASEGGRRWAAFGAAAFAGAGVLGIEGYFHYLMSSQSDSMLVSVCLAAIDCYLIGRLSWAWWLGVAVGLGRPEVWPFLVIYGIWILLKRPAMRWMVFAGAIITAFLWFGVPEITNHRPNIAGQLALKSPRELHQNKIVGIWDRFTGLQYLPIELMALAALVLAAVRRNRTVLGLAGLALGWVVVEIGFALHGFPGVPRYLFEPAGLTGVLAGITAGWLLLDVSRLIPRVPLPAWAGIPVVVVLLAVLVPDAVSEARAEHKDIYHERGRTVQINKLGAYVKALGGESRISYCGKPVMNVEYVSILGWYLGRNTGTIGYRPQFELTKKRYPLVVFTPLRNGWAVKLVRTPPSRAASCASMNSLYVPTARHPQGVLVPK